MFMPIPQNSFCAAFSEYYWFSGVLQVKCSLSGHEMPSQVEAIQNYIKGKKFQKLLAQNQYNYDKFKEHIVPSTKKGREYVFFKHETYKQI